MFILYLCENHDFIFLKNYLFNKVAYYKPDIV